MNNGLVYLAQNKINGNYYIGKTELGLDYRKRKHIKHSIGESHLPFHRALTKYGANNFDWEILENNIAPDKIDEAEKYYIASFKDLSPFFCYNLTDGGEGMAGFKHYEETKRKISEKHKGRATRRAGFHLTDEHKRKLSETRIKLGTGRGPNNGMWGKKHSDETKEKIRLKAIGRTGYFKGKHLSEETKKKISITKKMRNKIQMELF